MADDLGQSAPVEATPSTPSAPTTAGAPAAQSATPTGTQAPATSGVPDGWVPSYRVRETREAAIREAQTQFGQREQQLQAELAQIRSQLHALVGVQQPNQNPEVDAVRSQFAKLYPGLSKLEERAQDLEGLMERAGDLEAQTSHYWQSYGQQTMDRLFEHASTSLGTKLSDEGKRALHSSFVGFVQSSPEMTARYASDPTIIDDFWKMFSSSLIDPVRRVASANVAGRTGTPLPQDRGGSVPPVTPGPKPANLDERTAQAWAQYQATAKT